MKQPNFAPKLAPETYVNAVRDWQFSDSAKAMRGAANSLLPMTAGGALVNYMDAPHGSLTFTSADLGR